MEKITSYDFSEHLHKIEIFTSEEGNEIRIDHLIKNNSNRGYVKFVNDSKGLCVFGDFGNWVFCQPFYPSADNYTYIGYWNEKLKIRSSQEHAKYDAEQTEEEIQNLIDGGLKSMWGYKGDKLNKAKRWFSDLLLYTDDEITYIYKAFKEFRPIEIDDELIPFCEKGDIRLAIILDAFNEICNRC